MESSKKHTLPFKRKNKEKTNYRRRLKILSSDLYRFVVRLSLKNINVSLIKYGDEGDKVEINVNSYSLRKFGWGGDKGNIPSAYLIGYLAGKKAKGKKIEKFK